MGKIYSNCAATILERVDGENGTWYRIQSGNVTGYIKAQYFITGEEAERIAEQIGTVYVTINTDSLRLREQPSLDSRVITLLSQDEEYIKVKEEGDFVEIQIDADMSGYVHQDYVVERVEFRQAVSLEEERKQKEESERLKQEAADAIARVEQLKQEAGSQTQNSQTQAPPQGPSVGLIAANPNGEPSDGPSVGTGSGSRDTGSQNSQTAEEFGPGMTGGPGFVNGPYVSDRAGTELTSATRSAIVAYAKQFIGNPYQYGGTSLTEGADCSGFTMKIFEHFGIDIGRSSRDQADKGREISLDSVQPGDLVFYASGDYINHVAMYIGGGEVIHASTERTGIKISIMNYRSPYKAVTFLD